MEENTQNPPIIYPEETSCAGEIIFQPWKTVEQMHEAFIKIINSKNVPLNFMDVLSESVGVGKVTRRLRDLRLRFDLRSLMILFHYNEDENKFSKSWTLKDIEKAECAMRGWEIRYPKSPLPQSSQRSTMFGIFASDDDVVETPKPKERPRPPDVVCIKESWGSLLGETLPIIRSKDFLLVKEIIPMPKIDSDSKFLCKVLPYIIQKVKMGGSSCIQSKSLSDLILSTVKMTATLNNPDTNESSWTPFGNSSFSTTSSQIAKDTETGMKLVIHHHDQFPISRLDLVVTLLSVVDSVLAQDIVRLLGQFSLALPLIMPTLNSRTKESFILTIPMLQSITVKRGNNRQEILENHLFKNPFKMVVALRLGNNSLGKSTILNHLMDDPYMFSCSQEPGADRGCPYSLNGLVEFTWLTIENCKTVLWDRLKNLFNGDDDSCNNDVLLLANLHGNAIDFPEVIQTLKSFSCAFLVFQMPDEQLETMESTFKAFQKVKGETPAFYLMIDSYKQPGMKVPEELSIDTRNMKFSTLDKVAMQLTNCFKNKTFQQKSFNLDDVPLGENLKLSHRVISSESQSIIDLINNGSCSDIKEKLKLQKKVITDMKYYENIWMNDSVLRSLIQLLVKILTLPLRQRQIAFSHLDREISIRSGGDSKQTRLLLCDLKEKRSKLVNTITHDERRTNKSLVEIDEQIAKVSEQLERNNLGLEHFFRELGRIYEVAIHNPEDKFSSIVFSLAPKLAELVVEGQVIELLDGDLGRLSGAWLSAVSHEICKLKPNLKIFVISILGMQSSGKSTLLNSLFGCKFSVSSGRCTRGLFMRLLFLDADLKKSSGIDAILLIDTEGLGAPEKMRDPNSETRDRQMATFAMSISHLTIVNVLGESMKELADILQIVVVTLARLETIEITPDILLVQHGSEVDRGKFLSAVTEFCKAIKEAIEVTDKQFTALGILNSAVLKTLCERVENHEILKLFHPYRNGSTCNSSPSREYHEDVVDLYKKILKVMMNSSGSAVEFHKWHTILNSCWNAVAIQNFALRFKNIQEIHEFIDRGTRIANVNEAVEEALGHHRSLLKVYIRNKIFNIRGSEITETFMKGVMEKVDKKLQDTLDFCSNANSVVPKCPVSNEHLQKEGSCIQCLIATKRISELQKYIQGKSFEEEVTQTINSHILRVREHTKEQLHDSLKEQFENQFESDGTDKLLHQLILEHSSDGHDYNKRDGQHRALIIDNILDKLAQTVTSGAITTPLANLRQKMLQETMEAYSNTPIADLIYKERLMTGHCLPDFRKMQAFPSDISNKLSGMRQRGIGALVKTKLGLKQADNLEKKLNGVPETILGKQSADAFQIGMITKLREETREILDKFSVKNGQLIGSFKWEVHFYSIKVFFNYMEMKYYQETKKSRQILLNDKVDVYKKKIDACLSHGFSFESEGRILAECFLRGLRQKAKKAGDLLRKQELLHQPWLANTENVRLCFFETLAAQVQKGEFSNTLEYYSNPKKIVTEWFENKVDSFHTSQAKIGAQDTFNHEMERLWEKISTANSCNEIKEFAMEYFTEVDGIQYSNELDFSTSSLKNFKQFRHSLYKTLKEKCQDQFNSIVYKACSQQKAVMDRLGCTEFCFWCGALCWGHFLIF